MTDARRLVIGWAGLALLLLLAGGGAAEDPADKVTTLRVILPQARSQVLVDGKVITTRAKGKGKGKDKEKGADQREFPAPPLAEGKTEYEVEARWLTNDYTRFLRKAKVAPKPGTTVVVDLSKPDPKRPDDIEIRYVPTPDDVVDRMCKLAKVSKDDVVFDLGCGDGRIVLAAVADYKAKRGVGVDLDPERIKESNAGAKERKLTDKVTFRVEDVLKLKDLSDASVVMLYMGDDVNLRLRPILQKTLKPGSRVVSHRFLMGDWMPEKTETFEGADGDEYSIHLWTIK